MKTITAFVSMILAISFLSACTLESVTPVNPGCRYTSQSFAHVEPRHCNPGTYPGKSKFAQATGYCNGLAGGQGLCETVQVAPDRRTIQPDGRICYDKDMGAAIGTRGETWARVVIDPNSGVVVTQFPENAAGCRQ